MAVVRFKVDKLIRDNIPQRLISKKIKSHERIMGQPEYIKALTTKLVEEAHECIEAQNLNELIEELGDVLEVINALAQAHNIDMKCIEEKRLQKQITHGSFNKRIYCDYIDIEETNPYFNDYALRPHKYPKID
ncbi:MAG: nucleoside triphosphate pyrophosphohydrolase [Candidatus Babeliales bacterium]|nr:nucleoside triphosphate pyrophosphohydrolase [Candidatus Babeliales bacterium]